MDCHWFFLFAGFFADYLFQRTHCKGINCGARFTSKVGSFTSPGYPKYYKPNLHCVWTVSVGGNNPEIKLTFTYFDLPSKFVGEECSDFVALYSGVLPVRDKLIGKYCGTETPPSLFVKERAVYVQFFSNDDEITGRGFDVDFSTSSSVSSITTSQATAGIVAAIFCGIVFIGVGAMRCIMMGACQRCQTEQPVSRQCVGTNDTVSNYVMDCPPSYRTVMEHPEQYPTPNISPHVSHTSTPHTLHFCETNEPGNENEPPPPYSRVTPLNQTSMDLELGTAEATGTSVQQPESNPERRIPVTHSRPDGNLQTVVVHNNPHYPDGERGEESSTGICENERTEQHSANRRSSSSSALHENHDNDTNINPSGNSSPVSSENEHINISTGVSSGSLSIVNNNNERLDNQEHNSHDTGCSSTRIEITDNQRQSCLLGRQESPTHNNVWL